MLNRNVIVDIVNLGLDLHTKINAKIEQIATDNSVIKKITVRKEEIRLLGVQFYHDICDKKMTIGSDFDKNDMGDLVVRCSNNVIDDKYPADFIGILLQELDCHCDISNSTPNNL